MGKADFKKTNEPLGDGIFNGKPKKKKIRAKRADHKHVYETVLLDKVMLNNGNYWGHYMVADVCAICKRVVLKKTMITIREPQGWYRTLTNEEVLELSEYKDLPILDAEKGGVEVLVKTHLIVTDQYEDYTIKWCGRLLDCKPLFKNGLPIFIIITNNGRMEMNTLDLSEVEHQAKKFTCPKGRGSVTTDKGYIYVKEDGGGEKLLGVVIHNHIRKYAPMYDEL